MQALQPLRSLLLRVPIWLIGLAAGIVVVLAESQTPAGFWGPRDDWVLAARLVLVFVATLEPARAFTAYLVERHARQRAELVEEVLHANLVVLDQMTSAQLKWHDIGIHVWEVPGMLQRRHLRKVARVRIKREGRGGSRVRWTKGKGAIGYCWETHAGCVFDASDFPPRDREHWESLSEDQKMGLSWSEAQRVKGYGCIVVMPMFDIKGKFRGCVSVDGPVGTLQTMQKEKVKKIVLECANHCAQHLYGEGNG